ncbi:hypothetical protein [Comamonas sp. 4034]|uniref:hypothetical protein n=1 Tax=Comamonas sp. 4034 TaxID=3156455 RepID=UPI003D23ECAF
MNTVNVRLSTQFAWWMVPAVYLVGIACWLADQPPNQGAIGWLLSKALRVDVQEAR